MIERKIIIGLITSTEFCTKIKGIWNIRFIESIAAKQLATWCWEFYNKYNTAPNKEIESIYYEKTKDGRLQKDVAQEIEEEILPGLSEEYEKEALNVPYLLESTEKYFNERHLLIHKENIETALSKGDIQEAEKLAREFKPISTSAEKLNPFILTVNQIRRKEQQHFKTLIKPWLKEGQTTIIYGNYGSGKSLLCISVAYVLGLQDFTEEDCDIGEWQVKHNSGCLYIDGELGQHEMEERVGQFEWLGRQRPEHRLKILSVPEYQLETSSSFHLSDRVNQLRIVEWLQAHPTYKLVILDSVSTLFGLENENDNSEWSNKVNPLLRDLRASGVASILLHHSGKDNKRGLRGASAMGAMAHNIFRLISHKEKNIDDGEAWFILSKDKQRAAGYSFKTFALKYTQNLDKTETHWEVTDLI
jgi:hypothetical protein